MIKAVTIDKTKYEPFAIDIMKKELQKRNVNHELIGRFQTEHLGKDISVIWGRTKLTI